MVIIQAVLANSMQIGSVGSVSFGFEMKGKRVTVG